MEQPKKMPSKRRGFDFWRETLNGPRMVVAPMVDASELAWRMLSRRYGAELCYTPMLHSSVFVKDPRYRKDNLASCSEDRPLIVQFCSNDPKTFAKACSLAAPYCDAIDLNLGCPQTIAKKGHYGAFLMEEWDLICQMIKTASAEVDVPITAKIRVFPDVQTTIKYAKMLESAGASILTVHGRTRDQKGALTGIADWDHIKAVREAVNVPVFANGNIQYLPDVERCLSATGVQGVMSAEGNLHNPALFVGKSPPVWEMALEYLELVKKFPCPLSYSRGHIFKLMHHCFNMPENFDIRYRMSKASSVDAMIEVTEDLKSQMLDYYEGKKTWTPEEGSSLAKLPLSPWLCQPYVRIAAEEHIRKLAAAQEKALERRKLEKEGAAKREHSEGEPKELSRKKRKRLERNPRKNFEQTVEPYEKCVCKNPRGSRCEYSLCRTCCKFKCHVETLDCKGHRILNKSKQEKNNLLENHFAKVPEIIEENDENKNHEDKIMEKEPDVTKENGDNHIEGTLEDEKCFDKDVSVVNNSVANGEESKIKLINKEYIEMSQENGCYEKNISGLNHSHIKVNNGIDGVTEIDNLGISDNGLSNGSNENVIVKSEPQLWSKVDPSIVTSTEKGQEATS